ncbi:MAG TPA: branched-chain amino acid transport system II carrier protein, partial [Clostridiaceae bacterium]|nr:branched-chain amino acid transport system II carrier protein [Clostridiaceae bacterium]
MKKGIKVRDIPVVGFALFAMFLGAGNIIFPPFLGAQAGTGHILAWLGFAATGVGLPVLGVVAVAKSGGTADGVSLKVSKSFAKILNILIMTFIGPLFAIPRTAATTVELALQPFLPETWSTQGILIVGALIFFAICLFFVLTPNHAVDRIGTILTPLLVIFLLALILISIFNPLGKPVEGILSEPFSTGFTTGYQTMDALASIMFGGTVFMALMQKGYEKEEAQRAMWPIALIAGIALMLVYLGLIWVGASGSGILQSFNEKTALTVAAVRELAGLTGQIILAGIIFFACCTTAIGLIMTAADYYRESANNKRSYRFWAILVTLISYFISIIGVEGIIIIAAPLLELIYPVVIVLVVLNLFAPRLQHRWIYIGALLGAAPAAILNALRCFETLKSFSESLLVYFPFGLSGFGCFVPA